MKRTLASFFGGALIVLFVSSTVLAQGDAVESTEASPPAGDFTLSGNAAIVTYPAMNAGDYSVSLYDLSGSGAQAEPDDFWRLGITAEGQAPIDGLLGRVFGPSVAFRSDRDTSDLYHIFPSPGISRTVEAAYYHLLNRSGSYAGDAQMTLEVIDADGDPLRVVSAASIDLQAAPLGEWTASVCPAIRGTGEYSPVSDWSSTPTCRTEPAESGCASSIRGTAQQRQRAGTTSLRRRGDQQVRRPRASAAR